MMISSDVRSADNTRRKRIITSARKEQNRMAQQLYRQRQKDRVRSRGTFQRKPEKQRGLRPLEPKGIPSKVDETSSRLVATTNGAGTRNLFPNLGTAFDGLDPVCSNLGTGGSGHIELMALPIVENSQLDSNIFLNGLTYDCSSLQASSLVDGVDSPSMLPEPISLELGWCNPEVLLDPSWPTNEDILGSRFSSDHSLRSNRDVQDSSDFLVDLHGIEHELPVFTQTQAFQDVLSATIKFIRQYSIPANFQLNSLLLPNPYKNLLHCSQTSTLMACFHNALCIGMEISDLLNHRSPFYRPDSSITDNAQTLLTTARKPWIPSNLQPTLPQVLLPHHPYLDLIPFPGLRSRAITIAAAMPQLYDPMELKLDLFKEGMSCSVQGDVSIPPSDARSWQIAPWFVTKWKLLLD